MRQEERSLRRVLSCFLALLLAATSTLLTGCGDTDYRPEAVGPEGTITVVIDSSSWQGEVGDALRGTLGEYISTLPSPEQAYNLNVLSISGQTPPEHIRRRKNLVFVAPLSDSTAEAQFMRDRLPPKVEQVVQDGQALFLTKQDVWRRQQMVVYLTAANADALAQKIRREGEDLRQPFNRITRQRMAQEMFEKGRQYDVEEQLMEKYGFTVNVQHDYQIAVDTTDFVWLRRILSETWRSLFIYRTDDVGPSELTPQWVRQTRDSLTRRYIEGSVAGYMKIDARDLTSRDRLTSDRINFLDRYGYEMRGLWAMYVGDSDTTNLTYIPPGGPFVTYGFYDRSTGNTFLIDGAVYAPNFDKLRFMRQMEVIAHTFRTRQETQGQGEPVAEE